MPFFRRCHYTIIAFLQEHLNRPKIVTCYFSVEMAIISTTRANALFFGPVGWLGSLFTLHGYVGIHPSNVSGMPALMKP